MVVATDSFYSFLMEKDVVEQGAVEGGEIIKKVCRGVHNSLREVGKHVATLIWG